MIRVPPIILLNTISDFCIFLFRDVNHQAGSPPHFYVVFPVNAEQDLVVTIITSQVDSQKRYYQRIKKDACDALVPVSQDILAILKRDRESIVDCNHAELLTKFELAKRVDQSEPYEIKNCKIPAFFKKDICAAIRKSPLISPRLQKMVKEYLKSLK